MTTKLTGLGMALQDPEPLDEPSFNGENEDCNSFKLVPVGTNENIYKEICIDFENADIDVVKIERLTNPHLWKRYTTERDLMVIQRLNIDPDFKLNEKYLYHGTSALKSYICEEGLDSRMSKQGCFGKGIYFSDYPRKCVKYAEKGETGESFILLMRVILGTPKVFQKGKKDRTLLREPEKTPPYKGYRRYDSVEGCPVNHKEFVVYESRRALVECIISYKKKDISETLQKTPALKRSVELNDLDSDFSDSDNDVYHVPNDLNDPGSASSDDDDNTLEGGISATHETKAKTVSSNSAQDLLNKKKEEFRRKTGVKDEFTIDHYLLKGNLNVSQAIKLYVEKPSDGGDLLEEEMSPFRSKLELEIDQASQRPEHPTPDSDEWNRLSEEAREAIIIAIVDDFNTVIGMTDNDYAKTRLSAVKYNLDLAVLAHFEEMASDADYL